MPNQPPTELGDELNAWLAKWLMGWVLGYGYWFLLRDPNFATCKTEEWTPSTSTALALDEVAEAMRAKGWLWRLEPEGEKYRAIFWKPIGTGGGLWQKVNKSKSAAVCLAATRALYAELQAAEKAKEKP